MNAIEGMDCNWVVDRLVALQDGELSPGEETFVTEHLACCDACTTLEAALSEATPVPDLVVPPDIQAALEAAVDQAVASAMEEPVRRRAPGSSWMRWLRRDRDLSNGAMLAYGFVLAACIGWGLSNWFAVQALSEIQPPTTLASDHGDAPSPDSTIAPDQYRPASWTSEEQSEPWR